MTNTFYEQLEQLHLQNAHEQILTEIAQRPDWQNTPPLAGRYARALNNLERFEEALEVLKRVRAQGQHDPLWHYRWGYALLGCDRREEAAAALALAAALDPLDEQTAALLAKARGADGCAIDDPRYLLTKMQEALGGLESEQREGALWIPGWRTTVRAELGECTEQMATVYFYANSPDWDRTIYECAAALGQDRKQALGLALGSFVFGMLGAIGKQALGSAGEPLESSYCAKTHHWQVYQSNLIGMGETPAEKDFYSFWKLLRTGIAARLGNQQMVYVKAYAARNGEEVTGECRINDVVSSELSELLADYARGWQTEQFGSQKQLFLLRQQEAPSTGCTEQQVVEAVDTAITLFSRCETNEQYGRYLDELTDALGDRSLAEELDAFLPEFCAESAFRGIVYPETIRIKWAGQEQHLYKSQLASYDLARRALFERLGNFSDALFARFVSVSSIYSVIESAKEQGAALEQEGGSIALCCTFSDRYQLR